MSHFSEPPCRELVELQGEVSHNKELFTQSIDRLGITMDKICQELERMRADIADIRLKMVSLEQKQEEIAKNLNHSYKRWDGMNGRVREVEEQQVEIKTKNKAFMSMLALIISILTAFGLVYSLFIKHL